MRRAPALKNEDAVTSSDRPPSPSVAPPDPFELLRSRSYLVLLVLGAVVGVVVAFVAFFYLKGVSEAQQYVFTTLPKEVGFSGEPVWWPLLWLPLAGLLVALTIRYLPGSAGHKPAEGFKTGGPVLPIELPGIVIASLATLCLGVVLGPEAPLIAIGSGIGVLAVHLVKKDAPAQGDRRDRGCGQLRRDQHAARLAARRGVPADGGGRARRPDAGRRARAGPARRRRRLAHLRRAGRLDRVRDVLAGDPEHPALRQPRRCRVPLGCRDRHRRRPGRRSHPAGGPVPPAGRRAPNGTC